MTNATVTTAGTTADQPELGRVAIAHLGLGLMLVSVFTWIEPPLNPRHGNGPGVAFLIAAIVSTLIALNVSRSTRSVRRSLYGAFAFASAVYLAAAVGIWTSNGGTDPQVTVAVAGAVGGFLALLLHFRRPSIGTVLALGFAAVALALGLVAERSTSDRSAAAAALFTIAVLFATGALLNLLRPAVTSGFVSVVTGLAAAAIVVAGDVDTGPTLLALAMMIAVNVAALRFRIPSIVVTLALGNSVVIALVAREWNAPNWYEVGPAAGGVIAFVLAANAEVKATEKLRLGGAYALCALLALGGANNLGITQPVWQDILAIAVLLGLAIAAARVGRLLITTFAVANLIVLAPARFAGSSASDRHLEEALVILLGLLLLVIASAGGARTDDASRTDEV